MVAIPGFLEHETTRPHDGALGKDVAMPQVPLQVGVIGCGAISEVYLANAARYRSFDVVTCADLDGERARRRAREFGIRAADSTEQLLADPDVELVLNLTVPKAHFELTREAIDAGKSVYSEKPLAITFGDASELVDRAAARKVRLGCAPDTFLGSAFQTVRRRIDVGLIGRPVAAVANMMSRGPESWHPDPAFYYELGGGPLFDMGPYYLTALISLLGPVREVSGLARISFPQRLITSEPFRGKEISVETPSHVTALLDFESGVVGTLTTTFDVTASEAPLLEIHGEEGSLSLADPNGFAGIVRVRGRTDSEWREVPLDTGAGGNARGIGVADIAQARRSGAAHRASGELAAHVVDVMERILESSKVGSRLALRSTCERPTPLPADFAA